MDLTVCVSTFGGPEWPVLAQRRAIPSAEALGVPVVWHHAETLAAARNGALDRVETEFVIHLDADDELEAGYVEAMAAGTADVRAPSVRYVHAPGVASWPLVPTVAGHTHTCVADCLMFGNWLVVGAAVRADMVRQVGGWREWAVYEDWCLWLRCYLAGATFEAVPAAVYRAHVRRGSRNRSLSPPERHVVHQDIARANGAPVPC